MCEDAIFTSDQALAVIDGVTSKSDFTYQGQKTGRIASQIILCSLKNLKTIESLDQVIESINQDYDEFYQNVPFSKDKSRYGLQAVMAIYLKAVQKVYIIGDCQVRVNDKIYESPKKMDDILADLRSFITAVRKDQGQDLYENGEEVARKEILPYILETTRFMNREVPFGYSVLNGDPIPSSLITEIDVEEGDLVTLASDGYPDLKEDFQTTEDYLEQVNEKDPHCLHENPSTKGIDPGNYSFDDRSYIQFVV